MRNAAFVRSATLVLSAVLGACGAPERPDVQTKKTVKKIECAVGARECTPARPGPRSEDTMNEQSGSMAWTEPGRGFDDPDLVGHWVIDPATPDDACTKFGGFEGRVTTFSIASNRKILLWAPPGAIESGRWSSNKNRTMLIMNLGDRSGNVYYEHEADGSLTIDDCRYLLEP